MSFNAVISAVPGEGLAVESASGAPVFLALVDADGNVVQTGDAVGRLAYAAAIESYRNVLLGQGHLKVYKGPGDAP